MSLTHSDGYVMYNNGKGDHKHYWYDFWDADLGRPIDVTAQTHGGVEGLFIREFTNGWAVYNRSGNVQSLSLPGLGVPVSIGLKEVSRRRISCRTSMGGCVLKSLLSIKMAMGG